MESSQQKSTPHPDRRKICVWTLPEGSPPAVRVAVDKGSIIAEVLLEIACDALEIQKQSRSFFGLFKGIDPPLKKYGTSEVIYLPCRSVISILKWSFDPVLEARYITTDVGALRLIAMQIKADIIAERFSPNPDDLHQLQEFMRSEFPCQKQCVEYARTLPDYDAVVIKDVKLASHVKLRTQLLRKGSTVDVSCSAKKMKLITSKIELSIPWRKVRRWTQIREHTLVSYEIYLMDDKAFTWVEFDTVQAPYLLQVTSELIEKVQQVVEIPEFKQPSWVTDPKPRNKLTFKLIKEELFGIGKKKPEPEPVFDCLQEEASSDEDEFEDDVPRASGSGIMDRTSSRSVRSSHSSFGRRSRYEDR